MASRREDGAVSKKTKMEFIKEEERFRKRRDVTEKDMKRKSGWSGDERGRGGEEERLGSGRRS